MQQKQQPQPQQQEEPQPAPQPQPLSASETVRAVSAQALHASGRRGCVGTNAAAVPRGGMGTTPGRPQPYRVASAYIGELMHDIWQRDPALAAELAASGLIPSSPPSE